MTRKTVIIFFPTIIGVLLVVVALQLRETVIEYLYPDYDAVFLFQPLFDIEIFFPAYLVTLVIALIFQFFVTLKVWGKYKQSNKILNLRLWQLVGLFCVIFGIVFGFFIWYRRTGIQALFVIILTATCLAIIYWTANLVILSLLDKKKYGSQQEYCQ